MVGSGVATITGRVTGLLLATTCGADVFGTVGAGLLTTTCGGARLGVGSALGTCVMDDWILDGCATGAATGAAAAMGVGTSTKGFVAGDTTNAGVGLT